MDQIDNVVKEETYRELHKKYNKAIKEEFYFEAICIDYALLEDRLRSLLYYLGVILKRNAIKLDCQKTSNQIRSLYHYGKTITFRKMNVKIKVIKSIIEWFNSNPNIEDKYLKQLYNAVKKLDVDKLYNCLNNIESWCEKRDISIHASANRNIFELYDEIIIEVNNGMEYVRLIDSQVKKLKRSNSLRKNMNMKL